MTASHELIALYVGVTEIASLVVITRRALRGGAGRTKRSPLGVTRSRDVAPPLDRGRGLLSVGLMHAAPEAPRRETHGDS
jgi:hypothetical protein